MRSNRLGSFELEVGEGSLDTSNLDENKFEEKEPLQVENSIYGFLQEEDIRSDFNVLGSSTPADTRMTLVGHSSIYSEAGQDKIKNTLEAIAFEEEQKLKTLNTIFRSDLKNIPESERKASQFIFNTNSGSSLCVSICDLNSGGCHSFGESLAKELKADYIGVANLFSFSEIDIFKRRTGSQKSYHNISVTGCRFHASDVLEKLSTQYDFSKLKYVYIVPPPHIDTSKHSDILSIATESFTFKADYSVELLTTGIDSHSPSCIGLPNPLPLLSDSKNINLKNCYGLMYVPDLKDSEEYEDKEAEKFLNKYFSQVSKAASRQSVELPTVLIITKDKSEKEFIKKIANKYQINILFKDKMPPQEFALALGEIGKKGGVVANNGVQTIIQAILLKCNVLYYASKLNNRQFIHRLIALIPDSLKATARVILGLSDERSLLDNLDNVKQVNELIQSSFVASISKFEHAKNQLISSKDICSALNQLTHIEWKYDSSSQSAFTKCSSSQSAYALTYLESQGFVTQEKNIKREPSIWRNSSILAVRLTQSDIENLMRLSDSVVDSRKKVAIK